MPYDCEENCIYNCATIDDFLDLTDEMIETIIDLEDELVRWRQALIKYLTKDWAEGLRQDIFNSLSRDFEGDPAYDLYVQLRRESDPQQEEQRIRRLYRLADGTDETSITYL
ncbi:MAG: potassium channel protein [Parasporobacterium sp.]|nr:potassium channel protein [Parasporobacterium sp.]